MTTSSDVCRYEVEFVLFLEQSFLTLGNLYSWLLALLLVFRLNIQS